MHFDISVSRKDDRPFDSSGVDHDGGRRSEHTKAEHRRWPQVFRFLLSHAELKLGVKQIGEVP